MFCTVNFPSLDSLLKEKLLTIIRNSSTEVTGSLAVKALDHGVRGCGFESHQMLPRKGFSTGSLVSLPTGEVFTRLPSAQSYPKGK